MHRAAVLLPLGLVLVAGLLLAAEARGGDEAPEAKPKHLDFQRTYGAALLEARIRNVPVLVSRHKDF